MFYRKRAWDVMREDFLRVAVDTPLGRATQMLRAQLSVQADNDLVVLVDAQDRFAGTVGIRKLLKVIEDCVLSDERVQLASSTNWDKAFVEACGECCLLPMEQLAESKAPVVRPGDPLLLVVDTLVKRNTRWAVVVEGEKPLGVVLIGDAFREVAREMNPDEPAEPGD